MTYPYFTLHGLMPSYEYLRVFGCAFYPNLCHSLSQIGTSVRQMYFSQILY
jgi:hypothetical protein